MHIMNSLPLTDLGCDVLFITNEFMIIYILPIDLEHTYVLFQLLGRREISKLFVLEDNLEGEVELPGDRAMTGYVCN